MDSENRMRAFGRLTKDDDAIDHHGCFDHRVNLITKPAFDDENLPGVVDQRGTKSLKGIPVGHEQELMWKTVRDRWVMTWAEGEAIRAQVSLDQIEGAPWAYMNVDNGSVGCSVKDVAPSPVRGPRLRSS